MPGSSPPPSPSELDSQTDPQAAQPQPTDANDNAPVFSQSHYDAVLLADGSFHQPLVVSARDPDEAESANSQVAYEIIAGNQNEQFAIDALSGAIYATAAQPAPSLGPPEPVRLSPALAEPIVPFRPRPDQAHGKILPSVGPGEVEVEEAPASRNRQPAGLGLGWPKSAEPATGGRSGRLLTAPNGPMVDVQQLPALDLLLNLDSESAPSSSSSSAAAAEQRSQPPASPRRAPAPEPQAFDPLKVAPITSLVVRAHDFGIPIRSSSCKVNIYNQALLARSMSVILNGTAEQLEQRREAIERAFGALTGSRAQIESIEALSESSQISVARFRLAQPQHSLVDLTDLSALMGALEYRPATEQFRHPSSTHYIAAGDKIYPQIPSQTSNISSAPTFYTDINSLALDSNALERRLLIYIIIVAVCILALLVVWMIYSCSREDKLK